MKPISYTQKGDNYYFHYSFKDLRVFVRNGLEYDSFRILTKLENNIYFYKGYGLSCDGNRKKQVLAVVACELFDGKFDIKNIMNPINIMESWKKNVNITI